MGERPTNQHADQPMHAGESSRRVQKRLEVHAIQRHQSDEGLFPVWQHAIAHYMYGKQSERPPQGINYNRLCPLPVRET